MATTHNPSNFQPAFKRLAQQGRHDDTFAVIAMLTNKTIEAIFRQAEGLGLPKIGPFHAWIDGDMIAKLLAANGLVATVWKECNSYKDLPEVAIIMVDYDADWEVGRCVVFHRMRSQDGKTIQAYCVDSATGKPAAITDLTGLIPSWYLGVTQMQKQAGK